MMSKKKLTTEVLALGAASYAVSAATQKILLSPKKTVTLGENIHIPVQGLFALSRDTVASVARSALNTGLPWYARTLSNTCNTFGLKNTIRETTVWFVYDFLGKYSLNTVLSYFIDKNDGFDRETYKTAFNDLVQRYINEKADRDALIQGITAEIVHILRVLSEGTLAALVFNDRFATALSGTLAAAIDRFIENEAATRITDFFFDVAGHLEKMTFPNFLSGVLGMTREKMASYIDLTYDLFLGEKMVTAFENANFGDAVYEMIIGIDFDAVGRIVETEMQSDSRKLNMTSASAALYFYSGISGVVTKADKHFKRAQKAVKFTKSVFGKRHRKADNTLETADTLMDVDIDLFDVVPDTQKDD